MKLHVNILLCLITALTVSSAQAQTAGLEDKSPNGILLPKNLDTTWIRSTIDLAHKKALQKSQADTAIYLASQALAASLKLQYDWGQYGSRMSLVMFYTSFGKYPQALDELLVLIKFAQDRKNKLWEARATSYMALLYGYLDDYETSLSYSAAARRLMPKDAWLMLSDNALNIGFAHEKLGNSELAEVYYQQCYDFAIKGKDSMLAGYGLHSLGDIANTEHNFAKATSYYHQAISIGKGLENKDVLANCYLGMARMFKARKLTDSCINYARNSLQLGVDPQITLTAQELLAESFATNQQSDSATFYYQQVNQAKDTLFSKDKAKRIQLILLKEQQLKDAEQKRQEQYAGQVRSYGMAGGLIALGVIALLLWRSNRYKQQANSQLYESNQQVTKALTDLKAAQRQLVHTEKMASLGELTAGIAHEIQNPLNFVNNFSESNIELIAELRQEIAAGNKEAALTIAADLSENEARVLHHGRRAEGIVRNMLLHSRSAKGERQATDVNTLVEEYLRLSYHGMRAKDKSFQATLQTQIAQKPIKVSMVAQEIGRVLLNLLNNAFYAVAQQSKQQDSEYVPTVWVSTRQHNEVVNITITDNGNGIPEAIREKIFQPFFTTKPSGVGTGLGLSLSYDIIQAHGGELQVQSEEGRGAAFTVVLPIWQA